MHPDTAPPTTSTITETTEPPTRDELHAQICGLILRTCPRLTGETLDDERAFASLGVASMEVMCVVFDIEEIYRLDITGPGLDDFETVGEMIDVVHRLLQQRTPRA